LVSSCKCFQAGLPFFLFFSFTGCHGTIPERVSRDIICCHRCLWIGRGCPLAIPNLSMARAGVDSSPSHDGRIAASQHVLVPDGRRVYVLSTIFFHVGYSSSCSVRGHKLTQVTGAMSMQRNTPHPHDTHWQTQAAKTGEVRTATLAVSTRQAPIFVTSVGMPRVVNSHR